MVDHGAQYGGFKGPPTPEQHRRWKNTFLVPLRRFWDNLTGFDVCAFDDWLSTPDGISTAQYLEQKYGADVRDFVQSLI